MQKKKIYACVISTVVIKNGDKHIDIGHLMMCAPDEITAKSQALEFANVQYSEMTAIDSIQIKPYELELDKLRELLLECGDPDDEIISETEFLS